MGGCVAIPNWFSDKLLMTACENPLAFFCEAEPLSVVSEAASRVMCLFLLKLKQSFVLVPTWANS